MSPPMNSRTHRFRVSVGALWRVGEGRVSTAVIGRQITEVFGFKTLERVPAQTSPAP